MDRQAMGDPEGALGTSESHSIVPSEPGTWIPRLGELIAQHLTLYTGLDELSKGQSALIASGDADALLSLLGQRQVVVDQIAAIGVELKPLLDLWTEHGESIRAAHADPVRAQLDELKALVHKIAARDQQDHDALQAQRDEAARLKSGLSNQGRAARAYVGKATHFAPVFQDRRG